MSLKRHYGRRALANLFLTIYLPSITEFICSFLLVLYCNTVSKMLLIVVSMNWLFDCSY